MKEIKIFITHAKDTLSECEIIKHLVRQESNLHFKREGFILTPISWEDITRGKGDPQEDIADPQIKECHLLIIVLWGIWGNPTGKYTSGIEHEFELAKECKKDCLIFFSNIPIAPKNIKSQDIEHVQNFKSRIENERKYGHCDYYNSMEDFKDKFLQNFVPKIFEIISEVDVKKAFNPIIRGF